MWLFLSGAKSVYAYGKVHAEALAFTSPPLAFSCIRGTVTPYERQTTKRGSAVRRL
jgi:hypothetical protein